MLRPAEFIGRDHPHRRFVARRDNSNWLRRIDAQFRKRSVKQPANLLKVARDAASRRLPSVTRHHKVRGPDLGPTSHLDGAGAPAATFCPSLSRPEADEHVRPVARTAITIPAPTLKNLRFPGIFKESGPIALAVKQRCVNEISRFVNSIWIPNKSNVNNVSTSLLTFR